MVGPRRRLRVRRLQSLGSVSDGGGTVGRTLDVVVDYTVSSASEDAIETVVAR